jgi:hypothetical protein
LVTWTILAVIINCCFVGLSLALAGGCPIGYVDHTGRHQLNVVCRGCSLPGGGVRLVYTRTMLTVIIINWCFGHYYCKITWCED